MQRETGRKNRREVGRKSKRKARASDPEVGGVVGSPWDCRLLSSMLGTEPQVSGRWEDHSAMRDRCAVRLEPWLGQAVHSEPTPGVKKQTLAPGGQGDEAGEEEHSLLGTEGPGTQRRGQRWRR